MLTKKSPTVEVIRERVYRGIALLDKHFGSGGWEGRINLSRLDIHDPRHCMLGQLFGEYNSGLLALGIDDPKNAYCPESQRAGFCWLSLEMEEGLDEVYSLNKVWREEIELRLMAGICSLSNEASVEMEEEAALV